MELSSAREAFADDAPETLVDGMAEEERLAMGTTVFVLKTSTSVEDDALDLGRFNRAYACFFSSALKGVSST